MLAGGVTWGLSGAVAFENRLISMTFLAAAANGFRGVDVTATVGTAGFGVGVSGKIGDGIGFGTCTVKHKTKHNIETNACTQ